MRKERQKVKDYCENEGQDTGNEKNIEIDVILDVGSSDNAKPSSIQILGKDEESVRIITERLYRSTDRLMRLEDQRLRLRAEVVRFLRRLDDPPQTLLQRVEFVLRL